MSWKDCDCGMARIRAEIERCSTCEIAAHKDEQIAALTRELDEARAEVRRDGMSDSDFALRLASPAELREMVQTLTRERDEARDELDGIAEVLDEASVPQGADGPDGRRWTLGLGARVEHVIAERDEARYQLARSHQSEKCTLDPQTCKEAECFACGVLMCPHAEPMHLHHDGCPACHGAALAKARGEG